MAEEQEQATRDLIDGFEARYDAQWLAELTDAELDTQAEARETVLAYVEHRWEDAKYRGLDPAERPEWKCVEQVLTILEAMRNMATSEEQRRSRAADAVSD